MTQLPYPNFPQGDPREQLGYLKSYLYRLIEELNWALKALETKTEGGDANV